LHLRERGARRDRREVYARGAWLLATEAPRTVIAVRLMVGFVFWAEGVQKQLFPGELGSARFANIGIPWPDVMGPVVGYVELVCGSLILLGLLTRLATVPLLADMLVAIVSTKLPILLGHGFWGFAEPSTKRLGFWSMVHEMRTDLCMVCGAGFLLVVGAGALSLDARLARRLSTPRAEEAASGARRTR
jgi:uncharacterized membrane protein YphA (DoxX/SURF4 family)